MKRLNHIAFLMDGNRKWSRLHERPLRESYSVAINVLNSLCEGCIKKKIPYLTVYAFSVDNWLRKEEEIRDLFIVFFEYLKNIDFFIERKIKVLVAGSKDGLNGAEVGIINRLEEMTKEGTSLVLTIAFNYNGQDELVFALNRIISDRNKGEIISKEIDEELIEKYIYTFRIPDPDLIVRTAGVKRLTRFLLWKSSYAEVYFIDKYWPDFTEIDLDECILEFYKRERRYGE